MATAKRSRIEAAGPHQPGEDEATLQLELVLDDPSLLQPPLRLPAPLVDFCRSSGDILLVCKGGKALQCHSQMLACTSDVLRDMLHLTNTGNANLTNKPTRIPLPDDESEHWLQVLVHLYPSVMVQSPPDMTPARAMAAATLGHKYNIPGLAALAEKFSLSFQGKNPNVGHVKGVLDLKAATRTRIMSLPLVLAGAEWTLGLKLDASLSHLKTGLIPCESGLGMPKLSLTLFSVAVISHKDPTTHTYVCSNYNGVGEDEQGDAYYYMDQCIRMEDVEDASKGLMKDGEIDFQVVVEVEDSAKCSDQRFFSSDCTSALYVFKWLDLAGKIKHAELEARCLEFIYNHAYFAVFSKAFAADLHTAFKRMSPGQMYTCLQKMTPDAMRPAFMVMHQHSLSCT